MLLSDLKTLPRWDEVLSGIPCLMPDHVTSDFTITDASTISTLYSFESLTSESTPGVLSPDLEDEEQAGVVCRKCSKTFANKSNYRRHAKKHADIFYVFPCRADGYEFCTDQKANRDTHEKRSHKGMMFPKSRRDEGILISRREFIAEDVNPKKKIRLTFLAKAGICP